MTSHIDSEYKFKNPKGWLCQSTLYCFLNDSTPVCLSVCFFALRECSWGGWLLYAINWRRSFYRSNIFVCQCRRLWIFMPFRSLGKWRQRHFVLGRGHVYQPTIQSDFVFFWQQLAVFYLRLLFIYIFGMIGQRVVFPIGILIGTNQVELP